MKRFFFAFLLVTLSGNALAQTPATNSTPAPLATQTPLATRTPLATPAPVPTPNAKATTKTLSASAYRALLQHAFNGVKTLGKHAPLDARPFVTPLDARFVVKRADGQTQTVQGNYWNRLLSGIYGTNAAKMTQPDARELEAALSARLKALDEWTTKRNGAYYSAFDAQKVVSDAVARGQIRVAPPPAQQWIADVDSALGNAISNFFKWLASLLPKPSAPATGPNIPNLSWLWFVFWAIMIALLGLLLFLAARALSGGSFSFWGIGRRRKKSADELRDEDAALFQLAPDELRDRADAFASSGNFREALRHRFISVLLLLDERGTWRYDIRRTNWEHIAGLRRDETKRPLVAPLSSLTRAFDRVRYGGAPCDETGWNEFQAGVREVESLIGGRAQRLEAVR